MTQLPAPDLSDPNDQAANASQASVGDPYRVRHFSAQKELRPISPSRIGKRTRTVDTPTGPAVRSRKPTRPITRIGEVAIVPTIQASAVLTGQRLPIQPAALRRKVRVGKIPNLILFVVDASGSMAARKRMTAVKGAIFSLLIDAYQKRDRVGLITFRGSEAAIILPPTSSISLAHARLEHIPTGGQTPLAEGLEKAAALLGSLKHKTDQLLNPLIVVLSDGRANAGPQALARAHQTGAQINQKGWSTLVIDCESGFPRLSMAQRLAEAMGSEAIQLEELSAESLVNVVTIYE
ncbi:MAG: VWA domain-containing protein [Chloroflexota bacterium]